MKQFFINLISANSPISSKRFAGLITLASTIILAFVAAYKHDWQCPEYMYSGLLLVVAGLFGFNMAENIFKKTSNPVEEPEKLVDEPAEESDDVENKDKG